MCGCSGTGLCVWANRLVSPPPCPVSFPTRASICCLRLRSARGSAHDARRAGSRPVVVASAPAGRMRQASARASRQRRTGPSAAASAARCSEEPQAGCALRAAGFRPRDISRQACQALDGWPDPASSESHPVGSRRRNVEPIKSSIVIAEQDKRARTCPSRTGHSAAVKSSSDALG